MVLLRLPHPESHSCKWSRQSVSTLQSQPQVHGVDAAGLVLIRCQLKRRAVLAFFQKRALLTPPEKASLLS